MLKKFTSPSRAVFAVKGGAWVVRGNGNSDVLRGLEICLLKNDVEMSEVKPALDELFEILKVYQKVEDENKGELSEEKKAVAEMRDGLMKKYGGAVKEKTDHNVSMRDVINSYREYMRARVGSFPDLLYSPVSFDRVVPAFVKATLVSVTTTGIDGKYSMENTTFTHK